MKQVWQTLDGEIFHDAHEAEKHEATIRTKIQMFGRDGMRTDDTSAAMVVHILDEDGAALFHWMARANEDDCEENAAGIMEEDMGWFYWDEYDEQYHYISPDVINVLIAANHQIS